MSTSGGPVRQLFPASVRAEHERLTRRLRLIGVASQFVFAILALICGAAVWAGVGGSAGAVVGPVTLLAILLVPVLCVVTSSIRENGRPGPANRGPSSCGQVLTSTAGDAVWAAVYAALAAQKFGVPRPTDPQTVIANRSLTMASWGDAVTVRLEAAADGQTLVTVWSRPAHPFQWLGYGRYRGYANAILLAVPGGRADAST